MLHEYAFTTIRIGTLQKILFRSKKSGKVNKTFLKQKSKKKKKRGEKLFVK